MPMSAVLISKLATNGKRLPWFLFRTGETYLTAVDRKTSGCWRLMKNSRKPNVQEFSEIEDTEEVGSHHANQAGRGLALFGDLTSTVDASRLANPLPGYRDTLNYFNQFTSVLAFNRTLDQAADLLPVDPVVRESTAAHFLVDLPDETYRKRLLDPDLAEFIALATAEREFALTFARELSSGAIRRVAVHGDNKTRQLPLQHGNTQGQGSHRSRHDHASHVAF